MPLAGFDPATTGRFSSGRRGYGSVAGDKGGLLEIHSHPEGLPVRIDTHSESLGKELRTPLRIGVDMGHHIVMIDDPKYQLHQEEISVFPGTTASVDAVMKRAYGILKVKTDPDQATVSIGTKTVKSHTQAIQVPAGVAILIQVSHPEAKTERQEEVTIARDETVTKNYSLDLRPVLVSVSSLPNNADIEVDGSKAGTTTTTIEVTARKKHELTIKKSGYNTTNYTLDSLPGGGTKILPAFTLAKQEVEEPKRAPASTFTTVPPPPSYSYSSPTPADEPFDSPLTSGFWFGVRLGGLSRTISEQSNAGGSGGVFMEFRLSTFAAIDMGTDVGGRWDTYSNGTLTVVKFDLDMGLPITLLWLGHNNFRFFVEPKLFYLNSNYKFGPTDTGPSTASISQNQVGWIALAGFDIYLGMEGGKRPTYLRFNGGTGKALGGTGITSSQFYTGSVGIAFGLGGVK